MSNINKLTIKNYQKNFPELLEGSRTPETAYKHCCLHLEHWNFTICKKYWYFKYFQYLMLWVFGARCPRGPSFLGGDKSSSESCLCLFPAAPTPPCRGGDRSTSESCLCFRFAAPSKSLRIVRSITHFKQL